MKKQDRIQEIEQSIAWHEDCLRQNPKARSHGGYTTAPWNTPNSTRLIRIDSLKAITRLRRELKSLVS